jgi:hypothetical protein
MGMLETKFHEEYTDGLTKQAFKDDCDINKMLAKHAKAGTLHTIQRDQGVYGDFSGLDFEETARKLAAGRTLFEELPSEIQREFEWSPTKFFAFATDPENDGRLEQLLPGLAAPGNQLPTLNQLGQRTEPQPPAPPSPGADGEGE